VLLLFRFLITIFKSALRPRIGAFDESVVQYTVLPTDCDLNIHLNAGRFLSFMDVARMDLLARMRLLFPLLRRGWRPVMGGCTVRYRRSILPFQRFDIRSRVLGWDEKWFYLEHICEVRGQLCAIGTVRTLIRSKSGNVAPPQILKLLGLDELTSPPLPEFVLRWRAAEDAR
jgi:acyl-CoA thioesterase FadM